MKIKKTGKNLLLFFLSITLLWSLFPISPHIGVHAEDAEETYTFTNFRVECSGGWAEPGEDSVASDISSLILLPGMTFMMDLQNQDKGYYVGISKDGFINNNNLFTTDGYYFYLNDQIEPGTYTINYNYEGVSSSFQMTILDINNIETKDFAIVVPDRSSDNYYRILEDIDQPTESNIVANNPSDPLQLRAQIAYLVDNQYKVTVRNNSLFSATNWASSDPNVATITENGLLTPTGTGSCDITCTMADHNLKGKLFVKDTGVYVTKYSDVSQITLGQLFEADWDVKIIGNEIAPDWAQLSHLNMVLDESCIKELESKGLLGHYENGVFTPDTREYHTIWALKGADPCAPLALRCKELSGMTLTGNIVVPTSACTHEIYSSPNGESMMEVCTCYTDKTKLNTLHITYPDGTTEDTKYMPFTIKILDDTAENNMILIEEIEQTLASGEHISNKQKLYLYGLLYQMQKGYSALDCSEDKTDFPLPEYSSAELKRIEDVMNATVASGLTFNIPDDVEVNNLTLCAETYDGQYTPNQTLTLTKEDSDTSASTQEIITDDQEVIASYDINLYRQIEGSEETQQITETVVPLGITIDTGTSLEGQNIELIREHTDTSTGDTTAEIIPCEVDGTKVSFSSNAFSRYTLVKSENKNTDTPEDDQKNDGDKPTLNDPDKNGNTPSKTGNTSITTGNSQSGQTVKSVNTGDTSNILILLLLLFVSISSIIICKRKIS